MEERLERLNATREMLTERRLARAIAQAEKNAKSNASQSLENTQNREMADFAPP